MFRDVSYLVVVLCMVIGLWCAFYLPYRRSGNRMTMLWLLGWVMLVTRTTLGHLAAIHVSLPPSEIHFFSDAFLTMAATVFLWSFSTETYCKLLRIPWAALLMLHLLAYCVMANAWTTPNVWRTLVMLLMLTGGLQISLSWASASDLPLRYSVSILAITGVSAGYCILLGHYDSTIYLTQSACNLCTAAFLLRRNRSLPAASIVTAASFVLWSGIPYLYLTRPWPLAARPLLQTYFNAGGLIALMAALGMLMLLLEDEVQLNVHAKERERRVRQEMEAYAQFDLSLMPNSDMRAAATQVCQLAVEHSLFGQTALFLRDVKRNFYLAGSANVSPDLLTMLEVLGRQMTVAKMREFNRDLSRQRLSPASARIRIGALLAYADAPLMEESQTPLGFDSAVTITFRSQNGSLMGVMLLGDAGQRATMLRADDLLPLETLVGRFGLAIESSSLTQRLLRSEKLAGLGQLAGGVAHELNNPLTVVMGYSELMSDSTNPVEMREHAGIIHKEAVRMKQIVESLVRFWKPSPNDSQQVNLGLMLRDIQRLRLADLERRGIRLEVAVSEGLPEISGNADQLKQVFLHLLNNGVDAIGRSREQHGEDATEHRLRMDASFDEHRVHVLFSDTGPGFIDPMRVFDPFFTTKQPGEGTGLGLSICYGIVREHRGEINVFNLHPTGAAVVVDLPVRDGMVNESEETPFQMRAAQ